MFKLDNGFLIEPTYADNFENSYETKPKQIDEEIKKQNLLQSNKSNNKEQEKLLSKKTYSTSRASNTSEMEQDENNNDEGLSNDPELRKLSRQIKNKMSAKKCREKKKIYLKELEEENELLKKRLIALNSQNEFDKVNLFLLISVY